MSGTNWQIGERTFGKIVDMQTGDGWILEEADDEEIGYDDDYIGSNSIYQKWVKESSPSSTADGEGTVTGLNIVLMSIHSFLTQSISNRSSTLGIQPLGTIPILLCMPKTYCSSGWNGPYQWEETPSNLMRSATRKLFTPGA